MSRKYRFLDQDKLYFVRATVVNWVDLFTRNIYRKIVLDSWRFCMARKGMELYGWVIMTSHFHLIIGSHGNKMEDIMRDMKKNTSRQLKEAIRSAKEESRREWILEMMAASGRANSNNEGFQLGQQNNHPVQMSSLQMAHQKLDYIHYNPVEAGFVKDQEDWLYSSAGTYYGKKGLIEISRLEPLLR